MKKKSGLAMSLSGLDVSRWPEPRDLQQCTAPQPLGVRKDVTIVSWALLAGTRVEGGRRGPALADTPHEAMILKDAAWLLKCLRISLRLGAEERLLQEPLNPSQAQREGVRRGERARAAAFARREGGGEGGQRRPACSSPTAVCGRTMRSKLSCTSKHKFTI